MQTARELEQIFSLAATPSPRNDRKSKADEVWERRVDEATGIPRSTVSADIARLWSATTTGQEFKLALEKAGYILARGDRRDFCVVDHAGKPHSLARRLPQVSVTEMRSRMADVDRYSLPSVAEARAQQRAKKGGMDRASRTIDRPMLAGAKRELFRHHRSQRAHARRISARINSTTAVRAVRSMTRPSSLNSGEAQRQFLCPAPTASFRMAAATAVGYAPTTKARSTATAASAIAGGPVRPSGAAHIDKSAFGRAQAAFDAEYAKWQAQIDAVMADQGLSPDQRAAAVVALRSRQSLEANGARRRIVEEEKQRARVAKRTARPHSEDSLNRN